MSEFLFLYESDPIIVYLMFSSSSSVKQLVVSSIKEVIDKLESVTDAVKQWWLPRASLNEELIDTFVDLPLQWWIAWRFDLHFAVFVMEIANETILFTGR